MIVGKNVNDDPNSGWAKMFTGKPSQTADFMEDYGFGLVQGDGIGKEDVANSVSTSEDPVKGLHSGKRRKVPTQLEQG